MTPFEVVLIFLVGGAIILATAGNDHSETNVVCAVITVGLMHRLVSYLKRHFPRFGLLVDGTPLVLLRDRQWQTEVMGNMRVQDIDVMAAARTKGVKDLAQIRYAILERLGSISIIKKK